MEGKPNRYFIATLILGVLLVAGGVLYGGVDRLWQTALVCGFAAGLFVAPPERVKGIRPAMWWLLAGALVWLFAEFLPVSVGGGARWRHVLASDYGLAFPATRNPSPALVLDAVLVAVVAVVWCAWVRALARSPGGGVRVGWAMVAASTLFAAVCLWMPGNESGAIYGIRAVEGWQGFGPFPNRNHSAGLLAMGTVLAIALAVRCVTKRCWRESVAALSCCGLGGSALILSGSRGALLAFAAGVFILFLVLGLRFRKRVMASLAAGAVLLIASIALLTGGSAVSRLLDAEAGRGLALDGRGTIWMGTGRLIGEAPFLGHGAGTFPAAYPFHQVVTFENTITLHPESSWLLWLVEVGVVPVFLLLAGCVGLLRPVWRAAMDSEASNSHLRAGALAVLGVAVVHGLIDVPLHRWGTAFYALSAMGLALGSVRPGRAAAKAAKPSGSVPAAAPAVLAIALWWSAPLFVPVALPTPMTVERIIGNSASGRKMDPFTVDRALAFFPTDPALHEIAGHLKIYKPAGRREAWRHFQTVNRLHPGSWAIPAQQAWASAALSPDMAFHFWGVALSRSGEKGMDVLNLAVRATGRLDGAMDFWTRFAHNNPRFLLPLADRVEDELAAPLYQKWTETRLDAPDLKRFEAVLFYRLMPRFGNPGEILRFMNAHPGFLEIDRHHWIEGLARSGNPEAAWQLAAPALGDRAARPGESRLPLHKLEAVWLTNPGNFYNARLLVEALAEREGMQERQREVLESTALADGSPPWFALEAALLAADSGDHASAVRFALKFLSATRE